MADKSQDRDPGHAMFGFNQGETRQAAPEPAPSPPANPQYVYVQGPPPAQAPSGSMGVKIIPALVALLIIVSGVNLYLLVTSRRQIGESLSRQADDLNLLTRRMNSSDERYADLRGKFEVTAGKLHLTEQELSRARALAVATQKQLQKSDQQLGDAIAKKASAEELNKAQADANAKIGGLSSDLATTRKDLEASLSGTKGELTGAIARTHDELVELAHRTDRDYFEFNLAGKNARQKVGTVMVELARTNPKKNQFTVNLYFDDKRTERKDKAANEPVYFYVQGASSALELVVNKVNKNSVAGYLSAPKGFFSSTPNVLTSRPGA